MATPDVIKSEHPIYRARKPEWERAELRFRGGQALIDLELQAFDWETASAPGAATTRAARDIIIAQLGNPGSHLHSRRNQAVYLNFADDVATILVGHLMQKAPLPDGGLSFGTLGTVRRGSARPEPTRAEQIYYNVDGVGNDGSQWDNYWAEVAKRAMNTGHRWMFVEAPLEPGGTRQAELQGSRPWLVSYSPLSVTNWHYENGQLQWAVLKLKVRRPRIVKGNYEGNEPVVRYRLFVRAGWEGFGQDGNFNIGGWWDYDEDGKQIVPASGRWSATNGQIPMWAHFYERDDEQFSRPGLTELQNVATAYMNLDSAATFDAWDAGSSNQFLLGVEPAAYKLAIEQLMFGSKIIPVPASGEGKVMPQLVDGASGAVMADTFDRRLRSLRDAVRELAGTAAVGGLDASGEAKRVGFSDRKSPRLARMASEMEGSQNTAIHFLEQRWALGTKPTGGTTWPRAFELKPLMDQIGKLFDLEKVAGIQSETMETEALTQAIREVGIVADDATIRKIVGEYQRAATRRNAVQLSQLQMGNATGEDGVAAAQDANDRQASLARLGAGRPGVNGDTPSAV